MKKYLVMIVSGLLLSSVSFGAVVKSAKLDASKQNILIDVTYGGGCGEHKFTLKMKGCAESYPAQCQAELIETTSDHCEALISQTVVISLDENGLTDSYYKGASLAIFGDKDWQTGQRSVARVRLP